MKSIICLLVDRFHSGFLGPYGNAEIETPTFDRLAAESFLADRYYVDTTDVTMQCGSWWRCQHALMQKKASGGDGPENQCDAFPTIMARLNAAGYKTVLVTDDPAVAYCEDAGDFADVQLLAISENESPCEEIEDTHCCAMLATVAATVESLSQSGSPFFLWCQLRGFDANWDFPLFCREKYCGEDDPEPYLGIQPPYYVRHSVDAATGDDAANADAVDGTDDDNIGNAAAVSPDQWEDMRQSVVSAYAGGVTMFDELLEMLVEPLRDGVFGDETLFLFAGARGILFGEHDRIGISQAVLPGNENADVAMLEPLISPLVQVPLMVRFPDQFGATVRSDALLQPADVTQLLCEWLELPLPEHVQTAPNALSACRSMLDLVREEPQNLRECVTVIATIDGDACDHDVRTPVASCLVTPSWFLQQLASNDDDETLANTMPMSCFALYVKPDDRWDVNNVADRCVEIVEQLDKTLMSLHQRLADHDMCSLDPLPKNLRQRYQ